LYICNYIDDKAGRLKNLYEKMKTIKWGE